jgi:hypothetical protein
MLITSPWLRCRERDRRDADAEIELLSRALYTNTVLAREEFADYGCSGCSSSAVRLCLSGVPRKAGAPR